MDLLTILTICSVVACIFSVLGLLIGITALIKVIAIEKATHSVQFVPMEEKWASSEQEIKEINEEFRDFNEEIIGL